MNCLIIGAGQLGSRHLQSLLKFKLEKLNIFVIDPNSDSLNIAKSRASEIIHSHNIFFSLDWELIPNQLYFVVVATNSNVREQVSIKLLNEYQVKVLILEKVLFSNIESYKIVGDKIKSSGTICYVNHARRMFEGYKILKSRIDNETNLHFQILGSNWGLACNGLHYLDLIEYLSNSKLKTVNTNLLDNKILESKRNGFIEFSGLVSGDLINRNTFSIGSLYSENIVAPAISIMSTGFRAIVQENGCDPSIYFFEQKSNFSLEKIPLHIPFQSDLTDKALNDFLANGSISLTPFDDASHCHQIFLSSLLIYYNNLNGILKNTTLPIT
jgi:hypothetical protein